MGWVSPCQHRLWSDTIQTQGYNTSRANVFCLRLGGRGEAYGVTRLGLALSSEACKEGLGQELCTV